MTDEQGETGKPGKTQSVKDALAESFRQALLTPPSQPKELRVTTTPLGPLTRVGQELARLVLVLTAGAFIVLVIVLAVAEFQAAPHREMTYAEGLAIAADARLEEPDTRLAWLNAQFVRARANPAWTLRKEESDQAADLINRLQAQPDLAEADKSVLKNCLPLPPSSAAGRDALLRQCSAVLDRRSPNRASLGERVKMIQDLQKQAAEDRQAFRAFWLQASQMVLLNLFFPLLTALLGYIFGTQQAQKAE